MNMILYDVLSRLIVQKFRFRLKIWTMFNQVVHDFTFFCRRIFKIMSFHEGYAFPDGEIGILQNFIVLRR